MAHVSSEAVENFLACRLTREESRVFVRHLLARCPACLTSTSALQHPLVQGGSSFRRPAPGPAAYSSAFQRALVRVAEVLSLDPQGNVVRPRTVLE